MNSENSAAKDTGEWQVVKEMYIDKDTGQQLHRTILKRSDGFSLQAVGLGRELQEDFLVSGDFGEFKIMARRTEQRMPKDSELSIEFVGYTYVVLDTYTVYLQFCRRPEANKSDEYLCKKYSKDIESALLHFPVYLPFYKNIPVKDVIFDIGKNWITPHYVHADEIMKNGL